MWIKSKVVKELKELKEEVSNLKLLVQKICQHDKGMYYEDIMSGKHYFMYGKYYFVYCKVCGKYIKMISYDDWIKEHREETRKESRKEKLKNERLFFDALIEQLEKT